jgi:hypothetical protein
MRSKIYGLGMIFLLLLTVSAMAAEYGSLRTTLLNQDPDPAEPGKYLEVRWKVEKVGNEKLTNIRYNLEPSYPFFFDDSDVPERTIGDWDGFSESDEFYTLYYKLRINEDALEDTYPLVLKYRHSGTTDWVEAEYDIRVGDKPKPEFVVGTIQTSPTKLVSDTDEAEFDIDIENIGDGDVENVRVDLVLPDGFEASFGYSDRDTLGTIAASSSKTATFYVDIDESVSEGMYDAELHINYKEADDDDNEYKTEILPFVIPIKAKPQFEIVEVTTDPAEIRPGDMVNLKITMKNVGGVEAESVSLRAFKESSQPFNFEEKSDFVGKLDKQQQGEAVLKLTVDKDATAKEYILDVEFRSIDGSEVVLQDETINVKVLEADSSLMGLLTTSPLGLVIAAAIVLGSWFFFKSKNKK